MVQRIGRLQTSFLLLVISYQTPQRIEMLSSMLVSTFTKLFIEQMLVLLKEEVAQWLSLPGMPAFISPSYHLCLTIIYQCKMAIKLLRYQALFNLLILMEQRMINSAVRGETFQKMKLSTLMFSS